jgi:hypothetical protein
MNKEIYGYANPGHPIAFSGLSRVDKFYNSRSNKSLVKRTLEGERAFTLHRKKPKQKHVNPYFLYNKRQQVQVDLIDISKLATHNDGVKFLCVAIDAFTKKGAVTPQKNKSAPSTLASLEHIFEVSLQPPPKTAIFDEGREFNNKLVSKYLLSKQIKTWNPLSSQHKAAIAERFNRTLQDLIYQYLTHNRTNRYIDQLEALITTYNSRYHRTVKMSPNQADLAKNQYLVRRAHGQRYGEILEKRGKPKFSIGNTVRIKSWKYPFSRGYHKTFTDELFKIVAVHTRMPIVMYSVQSVNESEPIKGNFYESELQRYRLEDSI